jgi:hypothetical protein
MNQSRNLSSAMLLLQNRFLKQRKSVQKNIALSALSLIKSESCSLPEIAVSMSSINNATAASNELRISRFLQSKEFQIDDSLWRSHVSIIFDLLQERGFLGNNQTIAINVDFTSSTDEFFILSASIPFEGRALPLYFSMRNYPKKKANFDQIKMEESFIKELQHLLSNKYKFVIVADRGFGNQRFARLCESQGFSYILRIKDNVKILENEFCEIKKLQDFLDKDFDFREAIILAWNKKVRLLKTSKDKASWHIVTNLNSPNFHQIIKQYGHRFKCEKMFQDQKSSGFNIEKSKIRKYDRFKRILYLVSLAQVLMMFIGDYINDNVDEIKKKFHLHIELISAFSK